MDKSRCTSPRLHEKNRQLLTQETKKHSRGFRTSCERRAKVKNKLRFSGGSSSDSSRLELCTWVQLETEGWRREGARGGAICILTTRRPRQQIPRPNIHKGPSWLTLEAAPADRKQRQQWGVLPSRSHRTPTRASRAKKRWEKSIIPNEAEALHHWPTCLISDELESALLKTLWPQRRHAAASSRGR